MRSCDCHSFLPSQNYAPSSRSLANTSIIGIYVALWIVAERHRLDQTDDSWLPSDTPVHLAVVEAIKLALSLCVYGWKYAKERSSAYNGLAQDDDLEQFLPMRPSRSPSPLSPRALSPRSWPPPRQTLLLFRSPAIPAFALALLYTCRSFLVRAGSGHRCVSRRLAQRRASRWQQLTASPIYTPSI
ncbi:hypothetical protein PLICRDRAFT_548745 [Plicaturopsis crispa FD-325 SS-3]|nr:hypothetical protein PLICRDRAFT_548745 [Plicaturopsis crispa FD-325 SS-3]